MPTYEFRCPQGHDFEKFYRTISAASADTAITCPQCGQVAERRLSAGAGLLFKGSGFYITDYGKDGKKEQRPAAASKDGAGDSAAKPAEGAKSDAGAATPSAPASGASSSGTAGGTTGGSTGGGTGGSTGGTTGGAGGSSAGKSGGTSSGGTA